MGPADSTGAQRAVGAVAAPTEEGGSACAGVRPRPARTRPSRGIIPARGEHLPHSTHRLLSSDSSPHARGARRGRGWRRRYRGLIPACAGSTRPGGAGPHPSTAHPRMRGEHLVTAVAPLIPLGSSPHARGARAVADVRAVSGGLIPACAGSIRSRTCPPSWRWAHPRVRGEHPLATCDTPSHAGSSPRARGAPNGHHLDRRLAGLIPACAGSTKRRHYCGRFSRAHPRVRGEHVMNRWPSSWLPGSSPRARGARPGPLRVGCAGGLIPACAGSTHCSQAATVAHWAHPRVRGEHGNAESVIASGSGSSPHARGAHFLTCMFSAQYLSFHSLSPNSRAAIHLRIHHISVVPREPPHRFPQPTPTTPEGRPRELQQPPQRAR